MNLTANEIVQILGEGKVFGNPNITINSVCGIENGWEKSISYIKNENYLKYYTKSKSDLLIVNKHFEINDNTEKTLIKVKDPQHSFSKILELFYNDEKKKYSLKSNKKANYHIDNTVKIGQNTIIQNNCIIEENVKIFPNCFIGNNVKIKKNTIIYSNVSIYNNSIIGENCIIHSGAVIGADGFGFINRNKKNIKLYHLGNVIIKNNVEIGANSCIDKGLTHSDSTVLEENVKIDNLVQIGHNVKINYGTVIAGHCGIAGSTEIGKNCIIGGKVAISDHIKIADEVKIAGNSGVTKSIKKTGSVVQGPIAFDKMKFQKAYIHFKNLDNTK